MSTRLPASWAKKGSKMRNKPVWECPGCSRTADTNTLTKGRTNKCYWCNTKVFYHQSQKEYRRWCELKALEKAGQIRRLERQKKFTFGVRPLKHWSREGSDWKIKTPKGRDLTYTADFVYEEAVGSSAPGREFYLWQQVVEDAKGRKAGAAYDLYWLKRELMRLCHGIEVKEV